LVDRGLGPQQAPARSLRLDLDFRLSKKMIRAESRRCGGARPSVSFPRRREPNWPRQRPKGRTFLSRADARLRWVPLTSLRHTPSLAGNDKFWVHSPRLCVSACQSFGKHARDACRFWRVPAVRHTLRHIATFPGQPCTCGEEACRAAMAGDPPAASGIECAGGIANPVAASGARRRVALGGPVEPGHGEFLTLDQRITTDRTRCTIAITIAKAIA
jgi:hypothetical protein